MDGCFSLSRWRERFDSARERQLNQSPRHPIRSSVQTTPEVSVGCVGTRAADCRVGIHRGLPESERPASAAPAFVVLTTRLAASARAGPSSLAFSFFSFAGLAW
jgi:hypothetical protein